HFDANETFVLELLERRVDGAGAGLVCAAAALLQSSHELVAVAGLVAEEREQGEAELARAEEASAGDALKVAGEAGAEAHRSTLERYILRYIVAREQNRKYGTENRGLRTGDRDWSRISRRIRCRWARGRLCVRLSTGDRRGCALASCCRAGGTLRGHA